METPSIQIQSDDRVAIVGFTGSGKTSIATYLLLIYAQSVGNQIVIFHTKPSAHEPFEDLPGIVYAYTPRDLSRLCSDAKNRIVIYRPIPVPTPAIWNGIFRWFYENPLPRLIYIDEVTSIQTIGGATYQIPYFDIYLQQGRGIGKPVWVSTQNPVYVPRNILAQSQVFFVFRLNLKRDRVTMSEVMGDSVLQRPPDRHGFWYFNVSTMEDPEYFPNTENPLAFAPLPLDSPQSSRDNGESLQVRRNSGMQKRGVVGFVIGALVIGFLAAVTIPLWKSLFGAIASKVPAAKPIQTFIDKS